MYWNVINLLSPQIINKNCVVKILQLSTIRLLVVFVLGVRFFLRCPSVRLYLKMIFFFVLRIADLFESLDSLKRLDLSHNALSAFDGSTLSHSKQLVELDLSHNQITTLKVSEVRIHKMRTPHSYRFVFHFFFFFTYSFCMPLVSFVCRNIL